MKRYPEPARRSPALPGHGLFLGPKSFLRETILLAAALVLCAGAAPAVDTGEDDERWEDALVTDRPDAAESSQTVGRYVFQAETSVQFVTDRNPGEGRATTWNFPTLLRGGLTEDFELRLATDGPAFLRETSPTDNIFGMSDLELGMKYHVLDGGGAVPSTAFLAGVNFPTGSSTFTSHKPEYALVGALDWDLPFGLGLGTNFGIAAKAEEQDDGYFCQFNAAASLGGGITQRLSWYLEVGANLPAADRDHGAAFVDGGFKYLLSPDMQLDFAVTKGLNEPADTFGATIGFSVRWGK